MGYFKELNNSIMSVISRLLTNQEFMKLVYYGTDEPLKEADVNPADIINEYVFGIPKIPDTNDDAKTIVSVTVLEGSRGRINKGSKVEALKIDIMTHVDIAQIDEGYRIFSIAERIDEALNGEYIQDVSLGTLEFEKFREMYYTDYFVGMRLIYRTVNLSTKPGKC